MGRDLVNSVDLLYATPEKRIRMIKEALDATGKSFSNMNKFERIAIANAAGIKDMAEANKIFNLSLSAYDSMVEKGKNASASQEQFNNAVKAGQTFMKKLKIAFQNLAIAVLPFVEIITPLVDVFISVFSWINSISKAIKEQGGFWAELGSG